MLLPCAVFPYTSGVRHSSTSTLSPASLPLFLFAVVLFTPFWTVQSQQPYLPKLSRDTKPTSFHVLLNLNESQNYTLDELDDQSLARETSDRNTLLVQFLSDIPFNSSIGKQRRPNIVLYASRTSNPLIYQNSPDCNCSTSQPCFVNDNDTTVDSIAFYSNAYHAFVKLSNVDGSASPVFGIINYDPIHSSDEANVTLEGTIRVQLVSGDGETCPVFPVPQTSAPTSYKRCGSGTCKDNRCECQPTFYGRMCEHQLFLWSNSSSSPSNQQPDFAVNSTYMRDKEGNLVQIDLEIPIFQTAVVEIPLPQSEGYKAIAIAVYALSAYKLKNLDALVRLSESLSGPFEGCQFTEVDSMGNPTVSNWTLDQFEDESPDSEQYDYVMTVQPVSNNVTRYVSIHAGAGGWTNQTHINFSMKFLPCTTDQCPQSEYYSLFPVELMPILFSILLLAIAVMMVLLWFDRRHGFTEQNDKLSIAEVNRMYPIAYFRNEEPHLHSPRGNDSANVTTTDAHGGRSDPTARNNEDESTKECPICLCNFEELEEMRVLQCGHEFHSECIDVSYSMVTAQSWPSSLLFFLRNRNLTTAIYVSIRCYV